MVIKSDAPKYSILHDLTLTRLHDRGFTISQSEIYADTTDTVRSDGDLNPTYDLTSANPNLHTTNITQPIFPILLLPRR